MLLTYAYGSCRIDLICSVTDCWVDEISSVLVTLQRYSHYQLVYIWYLVILKMDTGSEL